MEVPDRALEWDGSLSLVFKTCHDMTPKAQATRAKINKRDYIKLKTFGTAKQTTNRMKKADYRMGENICKLYTS